MKKSLFTRYFAVYAIIIIVSITFLGAVLLLVSSQYFKDEKYNLLKSNLNHAKQLTAQTLDNSKLEESSKQSTITSFYNVYATAIQADFFFTDTQGIVYFASNDFDKSKPISTDVLDRVDQAQQDAADADFIYTQTDTLGGYYDSMYYTAIMPVYAYAQDDDSYTLMVVGYIGAAASADSLSSFLQQIFRMFILSSLAVMFVAFVIIYIVTLQMVKPLRQMASAAKRFGSGDFTERLPITSQDEIGELALALNNMAMDLSAVEFSRRNFVANVSHELRTPMTSISGFIDGILDGTIPPRKQDEYLKIVSTEVKRLSRLVKAMLNMARIESGQLKLNLEEFDINDIVLQTIFSFETEVNKKNLEVKGLEQNKIMAYADKDLIHQVIYNLTENAIKFSNENGYIEFSYRSDAKYLYIIIKNSGEGLKIDDANKVFERFYKADRSRGLDVKGAGIGLHIVKSIINLHKGEILVDSVPNEYAAFTIALPIHKKQSKPKAK